MPRAFVGQTLEPLTSQSSFVAGWYGKIPCLGDFASRRLPAEFIGVWDAWLQRSVAASRQDLGDAWLDMFLTSPIWRFLLAPGTCGEHAWAGVLVPSVDKVGRYFPLTIALQVEPGVADMIAIFAAQAWYAALENIGLAALNIDYSPDELERALAAVPFSEGGWTGDAAIVHDIVGTLTGSSANPLVLQLPNIESVSAVMNHSARAMYGSKAYGRTFWWSVARDSGATEIHCSAGLPPENHFSVFLGGLRVPEAVSSDPLKAFGIEQLIDDANTSR